MYNIRKRADGLYHLNLVVGRKKDGTLDRRHIKRASRDEVKDEADRQMEAKRRSATGVVPAKAVTVEEWLTHWLEHTVKLKAYKTWAGYRSIVKVHLIPHLGAYRLDGPKHALEPEHVEAMYAAMAAAGLAKSYIRQVHQVFNAAMKKAWKRGRTSHNVLASVDAPKSPKARIKAHSLDQVQAIIQAAMADRYAARWLIGIMLGLRQGEVLGLRWSRVFLDAAAPYLDVEKQVGRQTWEHGCADPVICVKEWGKCKKKPCPPPWDHGCSEGFDPCVEKRPAWQCPDREPAWRHGCGDAPCPPARQPGDCPARRPRCARHQRECTPPCPPNCTDHARWCPKQKNGGIVEKDVKSESGNRDAQLPPVLAEALRELREWQIAALPLGEWDPNGFVFATAKGGPIDANVDHARWEALLVSAGLPDVELHRARHDAGTLLVATGTDIRVVQKMLGHSRVTVTEGYVDVANDLKRQAVDKLAAALFDGQLTALLAPPVRPHGSSTG